MKSTRSPLSFTLIVICVPFTNHCCSNGDFVN